MGKTDGLANAARKASVNAYAPYSGYKVGAAIETEKGMFTGCNVENSSYGLSICAERNAVSTAIACGARKIKRIAVYATKAMPHPCGACLQVIGEFATKGCMIVVFTGKKTEEYSFSHAYPKKFKL